MNKFHQYIETGKNISSMRSTSPLYETAKLLLHRAATGYGIEHYTIYSLYNNSIEINNWRKYLDKRDFCKLLFRYNKKEHFRILEDKVAFGEACHQYNLPHPEIEFTYKYNQTSSLYRNHIKDDVTTGLLKLPEGDYIVKTCSGSYGIDLWSITKHSNGINLHNINKHISENDFATILEKTNNSYLIQKKIEVADGLRAIMPGHGCGSMRIHTFQRPNGTVMMPYGMIKLTRIGAVSDNFAGGTSGNMLAIIDIESRTIQRVIKKSENGLYTDISHHPDTGVDLRNYPVPEIEQALDLGRRCAAHFHNIPAVGWDIVVTNSGAIVLEGNPMFDPAGPQLCASQGVKDIIPTLLGEQR